MKIIFLSMLLFVGLVSQAFALDHLVISQILYDPVNTETGGEAIELYNPTMRDVNLSGYVVKTKTSATDVVLPNAIIKSKGFYLIGDGGWSTNKDNETYPIADYEDTFTLVNTDGGLALMFNGTIIDAVGWGNSSIIPTGLYEGLPSQYVKEGYVLRRVEPEQDTNNNSVDFIENVAGLRNSSNVNQLKYEETDINIRVIVNNSAPSIGEVHIEDDLDDAGIQIIPNVDANREIKFNVSFEDPDVDDFDRMSITFRGHNVSFNKTQGIIALESTDEAGNYSLEITVYDKSNVSASKTLLIEYKELSAVVLDTRSISLSASEGGNITLEGDKDLNTFDKPTIKNVGNTKLNLGAISSGTETLPFASIEFSIAGVKKALNTDLNVVNTALKPGQMTGLNLYLNQGINLKKGTYSGKVIIVGIPA